MHLENKKMELRLINIKTIKKSFSGDDYGSLSFFESLSDIPFDFKRIYYITGVKAGMVRGFHAHKELKQFIFCPFGKIEMFLKDGDGEKSIILDKPNVGILIDHPVWREMKWLVDNSVLCVIASDYYKEEDYIRDYAEFKMFIQESSNGGKQLWKVSF